MFSRKEPTEKRSHNHKVKITRSRMGLKQNIPACGETFNNRTTTCSVQAKYRRNDGWTEETGGEWWTGMRRAV